MIEKNLHARTHHTEIQNKYLTTIRVGQWWADNADGNRDPIRHFEITDIVEQYGFRKAHCYIDYGIDRATGERVPIGRQVRIDINRLHPVRAGYQQVTEEGDAS